MDSVRPLPGCILTGAGVGGRQLGVNRVAYLDTGVFLLSIDAELAWGSVYNDDYERYKAQYEGCRGAINGLLQLLETYEISATWAMVGHLFLDSCTAVGGVKHPEVVRPHYDWFEGDWFAMDPATDIMRDPVWYGKDIVERILNCKTPQEIGCQTFSHIIVGDPGCSEECFDSEIKLCRRLAKEHGIDLKSFVFPRGSVGWLNVLAANSFLVYRGTGHPWNWKLPSAAKKTVYVLDNFLLIPPPVVRPIEEGGIWNIRASYYYPHRTGWGRFLPISFRVVKAKRGLAKASLERAIFHMWFHPFNLTVDTNGLLKGLEHIFREVKALRMEGKLVNLTMGELAERLSEG